MKNTVFCPQFSPKNAENCILGLSIFKIFWGSTSPPPPPPSSGTNMSLLIQSVTLFKPAGYFNFYGNPCKHFNAFSKERCKRLVLNLNKRNSDTQATLPSCAICITKFPQLQVILHQIQ